MDKNASVNFGGKFSLVRNENFNVISP